VPATELRTATSVVMMGFTPAVGGPVTDRARFVMPDGWIAQSPFAVLNGDETRWVSVEDADPVEVGLRYGYASAPHYCQDPWNVASPYGRICVIGTDAPYYGGFASPVTDHCGTSKESYPDTVECNDDRRFAIFVRRPTCGDGVIDAGEGCDDGNLDNADGCTASCEPYVIDESQDCAAILHAAPNAPSGLYTIDPGTGPIEVWCDMEVDGGGWTRLFIADTNDYESPPTDYTVADPALRAVGHHTMIAYMPAEGGPVADHATFAMPQDWVVQAPMQYVATFGPQVDVQVNGESSDTRQLIYGREFFSGGCSAGFGASNTEVGKVCIAGTTAPFWGEFSRPGPDRCYLSDQDMGIEQVGEDCSDDRRFAIFVRRPYCGDGRTDPGEACDDDNDDQTDGCTSACGVYADAIDCVDILEQAPGSPSGDYIIDPTGSAPFTVFCDMVTQGGGWSRIFQGQGASYDSSGISYDVTSSALRQASDEVLIGFVSVDTAEVVNTARFAFPDKWLIQSPMAWGGVDEPDVPVWLGDATTATLGTLRYGSGGQYNVTCEGFGWASGANGTICLAGTSGPLWGGFNHNSSDYCANSASAQPITSQVDTLSCASWPFIIQVRRQTCGDGVVSTDEPCDDGNTDDLDGCSQSCDVTSQGHHCMDILETFTALGRPTPSGDYVIDPDGAGPGAPFVAACDMDTHEGGWTRVFQATVDDHDGAEVALSWEHDDPLLRVAGETNVLMGFAVAGQPVASEGWASYAMPELFASELPMQSDNPAPVSALVTLNLGPDSLLELQSEVWFGKGAFDGTVCGGGWSDPAGPDVGMMCVAGTTAPAWYGFGGPAEDRCVTSSTLIDFADPGQGCATNKRFALWTRPSVCGNGIVEPGEACDDADDDNTDGCSSGCQPYAGDAVDCLQLLEQIPAALTGYYLIDPDGEDDQAPHLTHCDMEHDGGGWTLVTIHSNDGQDTWHYNNHEYFTTNTTTFGALDGDMVMDFKSADLHTMPFHDLLFVHAPSDVWAAYSGVGDGEESLAEHIESYGGTVTWLPDEGFDMSAGNLEVGGGTTWGLCDTDLYFNAADAYDGNSNYNSFGPVWSSYKPLGNGDYCPFEDPGAGGSLLRGPTQNYVPSSDHEMLGFGHSLGLNTGEHGTGENHMAVYVRTARCGDGLTTGDEGCDDQNADSRDGCMSNCRTYDPATSPDCLAIKQVHLDAPSGYYTITPEGGIAVQVWCDMTTRGGGWTRLYLSPTESINTLTEGYDVASEGLRSTEVSVMLALSDAGGTLTNQTVFRMPELWVDQAPMAYEAEELEVNASVDVDGVSQFEWAELRFGFGTFHTDCGSEWVLSNPPHGRICLHQPESLPEGTNPLLDDAPFYNGFAIEEEDQCTTSDLIWDGGEACGPNNRFGIFVRRPWCGDGKLEPVGDENCDDGDQDESDGCTSTCRSYPTDPALASCRDIQNHVIYPVPSGLYQIDPDQDGESTLAYCDMETDGGGWTLMLSYDHVAGNNDALGGGTLPTDPVHGYSHIYLNDLGVAYGSVSELRFWCQSSSHERKIHFKTANHNVLETAYTKARHATPADWKNDFVPLEGHDAFLPASTSGQEPSYLEDKPLTEGAFWAEDVPDGVDSLLVEASWAIRSYEERWNCDDNSALLADLGVIDSPEDTTTRHLVWYRTATCGDGKVEGGETCDDQNTDESDGCTSTCRAYPTDPPLASCEDIRVHTSYQVPSGLYSIDPDQDGESTLAYCDMETDGGGWTLMLSYDHVIGNNDALVKGLPTNPTDGYSHTYLSELGGEPGDIAEVRFWCQSSAHERTMHFKTDNTQVIQEAHYGTKFTWPSDWNTGFTALEGHTAYLPAATADTPLSRYGDAWSHKDAFTNHAFYTEHEYHWNIIPVASAGEGGSGRFECDEHNWTSFDPDNPRDTRHQIWYRTATCGDGKTEGGETCDDGGPTATCSAECTLIGP
jgi:cysteine-rich repeat protein